MKIPKRMIITWSVSMAAIFVAAFGVFYLVLSLSPVVYGKPNNEAINAENLYSICYKTPDFTSEQELLTGSGHTSYEKAITDILSMLNSTGKTNKFKQIFGQDDGSEIIANNNTGFSNVNKFQTAHSSYIKIVFNTPQYGISGTNNNYSFTPAADAAADNLVWIILIPLTDIENKFSQHTWSFVLTNPLNTQNPSITRKFVTYGNYHSLAEYVSELKVS